MEKANKRVFGLDLLKVLAIFSIPSLHFCSYFLLPESNTLAFFICHCCRWLFFAGPGLFFAISGYLYANKNFSKSYFASILKILAVFLVYCALYCGLTTLRSHEDFAIDSIIYYFTNFPGYYWYIQCWLVTLLFVPFINVIVSNISLKQYFGLLLVSVFVISLPSAVTQLNDMIHSPIRLWQYYSPENFPILYYLIGAGFRKFQYEIKKSVCLFAIALSLALNAIEDIIYCKIYLDPFGKHLFTNNFYGNPFTVIVVLMLFALLYKVDIKYECIRKAFQYISSISLEIYCGLPIADIYAGTLVEKSTSFIEAHQLPYILKYVPWVFGELTVTLFIAALVKICFKMIKKLCVSLRRAGAVWGSTEK